MHVATNKIKPVLVKKVNQKHSVDVIIQWSYIVQQSVKLYWYLNQLLQVDKLDS